MSNYTPEQVEAIAAKLADSVSIDNGKSTGPVAAPMLYAYAATLRQQAGRVDEGMVDRYLAAQKETICRLDRQWGTSAGGSDFVREACRAGLTAALAQNTQGEASHDA